MQRKIVYVQVKSLFVQAVVEFQPLETEDVHHGASIRLQEVFFFCV